MGVNVGESFGDARHPYSVDIGPGYNGSLDFRSDGFLGGCPGRIQSAIGADDIWY